MQRVGAMLTLFARDAPVEDYEQARASDVERYAALFRHLLDCGIYLAPSAYEAGFVSAAHRPEDIAATQRAAAAAFAAG